MNRNVKKDIRNKARLICGLTNILQYDSENLLNDTNEFNTDRVIETVQDTKETVQNIVDIIAEIEYLLYLNTRG